MVKIGGPTLTSTGISTPLLVVRLRRPTRAAAGRRGPPAEVGVSPLLMRLGDRLRAALSMRPARPHSLELPTLAPVRLATRPGAALPDRRCAPGAPASPQLWRRGALPKKWLIAQKVGS